jgi:uncharacterized DUF497 family protein
MQLEWDERKRGANLAKHGLDFADAERFDWDGATIKPDPRSYDEQRYWAYGMMDGRLHLVAYTLRDEAIRIISFRRANKRERKRYGPPVA